MRSIVTAVALLICTNLGAFEIRPESLDGGAYDPLSSVSNIYFYSNNLANRCLKDKNYVRDGKGQPIHEAIIRIAYLKAYGSTIKEQTWLSPLLGGVEWNDDPEELLRKAFYYGGWRNALEFRRKIALEEKGTTIMNRSHYGDLQFLHAMLPSDADQTIALQRLRRWLEYSYRVAIGEVPYNTLRRSTPYNEFFAKVGCPSPGGRCTVLDLYDMKLHFRVKNGKPASPAMLQLTLQELATGAIAHVIQDSYSAGHTRRVGGTGKLMEMYRYDDKNRAQHCMFDGGYEMNKANIEKAIQETSNFMNMIKSGRKWEQAEPFFEDILSI
ncbi:hypothetical protein H8F23_09580 [Pseudomonas sp. P155]|uniref:Uncharacterized protein n=1 Tax=Pseudomonas neuropathica TaxID=2730425 RepID=A0ABS0BGA7_9PSED|nr:hypothetical protein [Pseudomonas neuropathica]MBF6033499.1 hypothetical protein [Pseudomonas neuropathica]